MRPSEEVAPEQVFALHGHEAARIQALKFAWHGAGQFDQFGCEEAPCGLADQQAGRLSLSETLSGSCERVAAEAKRWEMRGRAMCLEGRIQQREDLWANLPTEPYRQGCAEAKSRQVASSMLGQ